MDLDKEPTVNVSQTTEAVTAKGRTVHQAYEGGNMGWSVPHSTRDFFKDIRKPFIRSSPLACLDHCPRKFLYAYRLGIIPRRYESALTMGKIVHKILQSLFVGKEPDEALAVCERLLAKEQARLVEVAGPDGFLPTGEALEPTLKKLEEDYHKARATGLVFWQFIPFDKDKYEILRTPNGDPMIEVLLETRYRGLSRPFRTPCDLALVEKKAGHVWIVDFKTTSFDPKKRAIPTRISAQLAIYRLALQTHLDAWFWADPHRKEMHVVGSLHAIIKKPGIKYCPNTKDKAGFSSYIERLVQWYKDAEAKDPANPPMILDPNRFTGHLMTRELWGRLKQYCKACHAGPNIDHFYRVGEAACLQYNKICPYMELCNSGPAMWPGLIEQRYEIKFREDEEDENGDLR